MRIKQKETEKNGDFQTAENEKENISVKTMNTAFSVDDFSDPFWAASEAAAGMNRSQSEWALERFLEEFSGAGGAIPASRADENVIGPSSAAPHPSFSKAEEGAGDGDVVEIKKPNTQNHNQPPPDTTSTVSIGSAEYQAFLKNKLELACAAVALSRVFFLLQLDLLIL